jgi:hypothetical protein
VNHCTSGAIKPESIAATYGRLTGVFDSLLLPDCKMTLAAAPNIHDNNSFIVVLELGIPRNANQSPSLSLLCSLDRGYSCGRKRIDCMGSAFSRKAASPLATQFVLSSPLNQRSCIDNERAE